MMENQAAVVHTSRLTLRRLEPGDAEVLYRINQCEGVLRFFPSQNPPALDRVQRWVTNQQAHWEKYGYGNWGILPVGESQIVGWAGLQFLPELNETEVGFLLEPRCWGKGYATEAAKASLEFAFERAGLNHVIALVHEENMASRRVIEKCGMGYVETIFLWGVDLMRYRVVRPAAS